MKLLDSWTPKKNALVVVASPMKETAKVVIASNLILILESHQCFLILFNKSEINLIAKRNYSSRSHKLFPSSTKEISKASQDSPASTPISEFFDFFLEPGFLKPFERCTLLVFEDAWELEL